jgi:hypothetical protein
LRRNGTSFAALPLDLHVLNIFYVNRAPDIFQGGFFPEGLNRRIRAT